MKILITGATGFVGKNLKPYLEKKCQKVFTFGRIYENKCKYLYSKNIQEY